MGIFATYCKPTLPELSCSQGLAYRSLWKANPLRHPVLKDIPSSQLRSYPTVMHHVTFAERTTRSGRPTNCDVVEGRSPTTGEPEGTREEADLITHRTHDYQSS
ncbi:hypothetical protein G6F47_012198 [Rhizopus delemar]|nr:hypothetical protein G6F36_009119 [Rhizopus arrhizus]KAG1489274.1 hypothetical protein G6F54_011554 [Rhizopus delemar]KAG1541572.1 hypothetical protein G6F49_011848 [Rhizopus delemar]KAG1578164.1 hypothetical protein G6F48_012154 [Rhizopus delemar]KAG1582519.1 hypothetical protein G6F47_012198 [Rhizopus delemar]